MSILSPLSFITLEIGVALAIGIIIAIWLMGKVWKLFHNKYFWFVFLVGLGALGFALYDLGHRQTFWKWLGISRSAVGWTYEGGKTQWVKYGDSIIAGWFRFIGYFKAHPSIGWTVALSLGGILLATLGLIVIARVGDAGFRFARKKSVYYGVKSLFVACVTILILEFNIMVLNPELTLAIKSFIITQVGSLTFGDVIGKPLKGGISAILYKED